MGEVFAGRFELIDPVAAGGMGEVWTAKDLRDNAIVAVKLLKQADAGGLLRFMREQGLRIHHEHILTPLAWAGIDDRVLFSMPLARGGAVSGLMKQNGPLPERFAAELIRQTLDALRAVHAAEVVHRDVKPANLLLDATGTGRPNLLLSDFGVALPLDEPRLTAKAWVIGTPGYLAPEQAAGGEPAPEQDLYAVGMVGKEMLTGKRPKRDGSAELPPPPGTHQGLWDLLERLTADDPNARPSLDEAMRVLSDPALAWQDQSAVSVPTLIRPDGHLAGADDTWGAQTVQARPQPTQPAAGAPVVGPFSAPAPAPYQGQPPQSAPSAPYPGMPHSVPSAPHQPGPYQGVPQSAPSAPPPGQFGPYAGQGADPTTLRGNNQGNAVPALAFGSTPVAATAAGGPSRGRRLAPLALIALGALFLILAIVFALIG